jgi:hypothetical protein
MATPPYKNLRVTKNGPGKFSVVTSPLAGAPPVAAAPPVAPAAAAAPAPAGSPAAAAAPVAAPAPAAPLKLTTPQVIFTPEATPETNADRELRTTFEGWTSDQKIALIKEIPALNWPEQRRELYSDIRKVPNRGNVNKGNTVLKVGSEYKTGHQYTNKNGIIQTQIVTPTADLQDRIRREFAAMINCSYEGLKTKDVRSAGSKDGHLLPDVEVERLRGLPIFTDIFTGNYTQKYDALKRVYRALGMPSELVNSFDPNLVAAAQVKGAAASGGSRKKRNHSQRKRSYHKKRMHSCKRRKHRTHRKERKQRKH